MVTNAKAAQAIAGRFVLPTTLYGLSTDTKPTDVANGPTFYEIDTDKMYRFNYSGATWTETTHYGSDGFGPAPSGGGGGGSTGGGVLVVHMDDDTGALDKTWQEIADADCVVFPYADSGFTFYAQRTAVYPAVFGVMFTAIDPSGNIIQLSFQAASADGYPVAQNA